MIMIKEKSGFFVTITIQMKETVCFSEMLYFARCKAANFGGMGNSIHEIWIEENTKQIQDLMKKFEEGKQPDDICRLVDGTQYLEIGLLLNSGDIMLIICEGLCWEKESLDKKLRIKNIEQVCG